MKKYRKILIPCILILAIMMIIASVFLYRKYSPGKTKMALTDYFNSSGSQVSLILQDTVSDEKGVYKDGCVYVSISCVQNYLNERFYWDSNEKKLIYTTAEKIISIDAGSKKYTVNNSFKNFDNIIAFYDDSTAYVNIDFVKKYSAFTYKKYSSPERVVINYKFDVEQTYADAEKTAALRYRAGIKSDILQNMKKGDKLLILSDKADSNGYVNAMSQSGVIGYIKENRLGKTYKEKLTTDYKEEKYSHILMDTKVCLGWHQVTSEAANSSVDGVLTSSGDMNVIVPTWFQVSGNYGEITSIADYGYIEKAHNTNIKVWGLCDDFSDDSKIGKVLASTTSRQKLEKNLVAEAIKYSLDGLNIDFENVKEENGQDFVEFIREISIMCRNNGIVLSIDNYPPTSGTEYYDRQEQANVADYVITMAYDEHYAGDDEAGPVSSLPFVKESTENTLKEVPANQTIIGLPFYCRLWSETTKSGKVKLSSYAYSMKYAPNILQDAGIDPKWDSANSMYYGEYKKNGTDYKMWLEDDKSLELKMKEVMSNDVAGLAFWKLGLETTTVWSKVSNYLK